MTERMRLPFADGSSLEEVKVRLSQETEFLSAHEVTDANLLTSIVVSLAVEYDAYITNIRFDQWAGVTAQANDGEFEMYVECDRVEHGIAALWKAFADR